MRYYHYYIYSVHRRDDINKISAQIEVKLENKIINVQVDSGASVNVINDFKFLTTNVKLHKSRVQLYAYGSTKPLPVIG